MSALPTLLSHALVAFTIELDNELERRMPHRTSKKAGRPGAPWLVSAAMWFNCMKLVDERGITIRDLEGSARTRTNLDGMRRWGYLTIEPAANARATKRPGPDSLLVATKAGVIARLIWRPLFGEIEDRWRARFGKDRVERLRRSLETIDGRLDSGLSDCLPILVYGLFNPREPVRPAGGDVPAVDPSLASLLSRVLLAFALDFGAESAVSLAVCANVLRVLDREGLRVAKLPLASGVSKEALAVAMGWLQKKRLAAIAADPSGGRLKVARLTAGGSDARDEYVRLLDLIDARWRERFGERAIKALRASLDDIAGDAAGSRLREGLTPPPDGWRASIPRPETLPQFPMVLHRGGYPDGS